MSIPAICGLIEAKLQALTPQLPTAFENIPFEPPATIYQRAGHLINKPRNHAITLDMLEWRGVFQVLVCAPLDKGRGAAQARAQLLADHFAPAQTLSAAGVRVELLETPDVASGFRADDRWCVPVSVTWSAFKT